MSNDKAQMSKPKPSLLLFDIWFGLILYINFEF